MNQTSVAETTRPAPTQGRGPPEGVDIHVRKVNFEYHDDSLTSWNEGGPVICHFLHALSSVFPEGERFFMDSVRNYSGQIADPELKRQVAAFMAQEALHGRAHEQYNDRMTQAGFQLPFVEKWLRRGLNFIRRFGPKKSQLAITCALEHFTAILAHQLLSDPALRNSMTPEHRALWTWHAVEESEHKAVAYDVYEAVGGGYVRRVLVMAATSAVFIAAIGGIYALLLAREGLLWRPSSYVTMFKWAFVNPAPFIKVVPRYLQYYKPGFHPWDHNNSALIEEWRRQYELKPGVVGAVA